jgi:hypothetical protein
VDSPVCLGLTAGSPGTRLDGPGGASGLMRIEGAWMSLTKTPLGCHLSECISIIVVPPWDMMQLDSSELVLQFAHLRVVRVHEVAFAVGLFHDLVHYQPRVAVDVEPSGPELDSNAEAIDEALIFGDVV